LALKPGCDSFLMEAKSILNGGMSTNGEGIYKCNQPLLRVLVIKCKTNKVNNKFSPSVYSVSVKIKSNNFN
jgi:hypothetical protein